jgi:hypothetical protein
MSKQVTKEMYYAMVDLLAWYKDGVSLKDKYGAECPLCCASSPGCTKCAWMIFEGKDCFDWEEEMGFGEDAIVRARIAPDLCESNLVKLRIEMLERWCKESKIMLGDQV